MNPARLKGFIIIGLFMISHGLSKSQDDRAGKILDRLSGQTISAPSVAIDFTFTVSNLRDDFMEEYDGRMTLKGEKYRISIIGMESWFDGTSIYTYMSDVNEIMISDPDEEGGLMSNPAKLFTIYREEFRYRLIGETIHSGTNLYEIDLHPIDLSHDFHTVKLFIDRDKYFLHSAVVSGKDGNRYTFMVHNYDNRREVPDSYFVFRKEDYPEVEIIDLRW